MRPHPGIGVIVRMGCVGLALAACAPPGSPPSSPPTGTAHLTDRKASIPGGAVKVTPADDIWPPTATAGWDAPEPLGLPIDTAGAEDSPFLTADGSELYFFFTPDLNIPAERQLGDGVTGIWVARREASDGWSEPERVVLNDPGQVTLDGCEFVLGDVMFFCSARAGNLRDIDLYTARRVQGKWTDWQNAGRQVNLEYEVGEMHITSDGRTMYFGSSRSGGLGGRDLWRSEKTADGWAPPVNLGTLVNTSGDEDRPYVSPDGKELWFDGTSRHGRPGPAVFRSMLQPDGSWGVPEEIISTLAGEPTLSADGRTLYFVHHFFTSDLKHAIEADIYVTHRK